MLFGELAKLTVVALTPCTMLRITSQAISKSLVGSPQLAERIAHAVCQATQEREALTNGSSMSVHVRVLHLHSLPEDIDLGHAQVCICSYLIAI